MKKEGKLEKYLAEKAKKEANAKPVEQPETWSLDKILQQYKEAVKFGAEDSGLRNCSKFDVDQKKVEVIVARMRRKKKLEKARQARLEEDEFYIEDPKEFQPRMAGKTGLPVFFFSNIVQQNRSAFQNAVNRNRMILKLFTPSE